MQWRDKIDDTVRAIKEIIGEVKDAIIETANEFKETTNRIWDAITFWN